MGKFSNIIIGSDLDGTFFSQNPDGYNKNIKAVEKFKKEGGLFTFVTGRDLFSLNHAVKNVAEIANAPVILANGARLYDYKTNKFVIDINMNFSRFIEFLNALYEKFPDIGVRISYDDGFYIPVDNEMIRKDLGKDYKNIAKSLPIKKMDANVHKFCKAVLAHTPETLDEVRKFGAEFDTNKDFFFTKSYPTGLELVNSKSTKGKMLKMLRDIHLKTPEKIIFAIGDYDNDFDMIQSADYGACPENASEHIKEIAKIKTVHCEKGAVADLIRIIENGEYTKE